MRSRKIIGVEEKVIWWRKMKDCAEGCYERDFVERRGMGMSKNR